MFLQNLAAALADGSVSYCVVGGIAVNLHGVPRMTYDIDIVISTGASNDEHAHAALLGLELQARQGLGLPDLADEGLRRRLKAERLLLALTCADPANPMREVDVLVDPDVDADGLVMRAVLRPLGRETLRIVSREDLMTMKRRVGRPRDLGDVAALKGADE
jgi:hypothetical protein